MKYTFHPEAEQEFIESAYYYETEVKGLGEQFAFEVQEVINYLLEFPEMGTTVSKPFRKFTLQQFPYSLIYTIFDEAILIIAVAHHSRKPGYWKARING